MVWAPSEPLRPKQDLNPQTSTPIGKNTTKHLTPKTPNAVILAILGALVFSFPGLGYIAIKETRRGIIYGLLSWAISLTTIFLAIFFIHDSPIFCMVNSFLPILPLTYNILVIYDTYLFVNNKKTIFP